MADTNSFLAKGGSDANLVKIPANPSDPTGLSSYRITLPRARIPVIADDLPLAPIVGFKLIPPQSLQVALCQGYPYAVNLNDGSSRCSWWLDKLLANENTVTAPPDIEFAIRQTVDGLPSERRFQGVLTTPLAAPGTNGYAAIGGLLVQRGGLLSTQWEFWARVIPQPGVVLSPVDIVLQVLFDRIGDNNQIIVGSNVTQFFPVP